MRLQISLYLELLQKQQKQLETDEDSVCDLNFGKKLLLQWNGETISTIYRFRSHGLSSSFEENAKELKLGR